MKEERGKMEAFKTAEINACLNSYVVNIPEKVKVIEEGALCGQKGIKKVVMPDDVEEIGPWAFYGCESLSAVELPRSIRKIGENAFLGTAFYNDEKNWSDESLYLGRSLIKVRESAGKTCYLRSGTEIISSGAFRDCESLERVMIPDTVTQIGDDIFAGCRNLKAVYGGVDTEAERYAKENGIKFIAVEIN